MPSLKQLRFHFILVVLVVTFHLWPSIMYRGAPYSSSAQAQEAATNSSDNAVGLGHPYTNSLIHESSPYLLQHAHNPVNWQPWGEEAFAEAKREDKPIFLSIGYSTCYWCHVMEVESFEDPEVAAVINEHFVAIKVDREERPDIDEQYMVATQLLTQSGGWPNSVWLTPEGKPWMAGTYFPKKQFISVLNQLNELWKNRRVDVDKQAEAISEATKRIDEPSSIANTQPQLTPELIQQATQHLLGRFDSERGGFHGVPKFPPHSALRLLFQQYRDKPDKTLLQPITKNLEAMWLGGIHDHIGGGEDFFSRIKDLSPCLDVIGIGKSCSHAGVFLDHHLMAVGDGFSGGVRGHSYPEFLGFDLFRATNFHVFLPAGRDRPVRKCCGRITADVLTFRWRNGDHEVESAVKAP